MTDTIRTDADREREAEKLADQALKAGPALMASLAEVMTGIADLVSGRKVVAFQHIERPVADREDAGLGQWDTYARVIDADDQAEG